MTRLVALVAFLAIVLACFATCSGDDTPEPVTIAAEDPGDAAAPAHREMRRHVTRTPEGDAEPDTAIDVGPLFEQSVPPGWGTAPVDAAPDPDAPPTGRVRVLFLKDGLPFEGGHVCFYPADGYVEAMPWDGEASSDYAYAGLPLYTTFWAGYDPVLGSADGAQNLEERSRGVTDADGIVTLDVRAGVRLVPYVRYTSSGIPLLAQPRISVDAGGETTLTIEAAPVRPLVGRCIDATGAPLAGIWVQAIAPHAERPVARRAETAEDGTFRLEVFGADPYVRVRAIVPYVAHPLGIYDSEADVPPIPAETTVTGVVPGAAPVDVRMPNAPLTFIELTIAEGETPLGHVQIEGLVFDRRASAWGRLGGPAYGRRSAQPGGRRAVIALPRSEAARPLMLWSWGWTITAVDTRGAERVSVEMRRGRWAGVRGRGWRAGDRLRVVAFLGPEGEEMPCIWIDGPVEAAKPWERGDSPVSAIEFQIVRDGVVIGRSARVPPGTGRATEVSIDLE